MRSMKDGHPRLPERLRVLDSVMVIGVCAALFWLGDAAGYPDGSPVKLFTGQVVGLLEGSGHSLSQVAASIAFLELFSHVTEEELTLKQIYLATLAFNLILEIAGPLLNSVPDIKDLGVISLTTAVLYLIHNFVIQSEQKAYAVYLAENKVDVDGTSLSAKD